MKKTSDATGARADLEKLAAGLRSAAKKRLVDRVWHRFSDLQNRAWRAEMQSARRKQQCAELNAEIDKQTNLANEAIRAHEEVIQMKQQAERERDYHIAVYQDARGKL